MSFSLDDIEFLSSDPGRRLLESHADSDVSGANTLALLSQLRQALSPQQAAAVLSTLRLRKKGEAEIPASGTAACLFTEDGLATGEPPAH